MKSKRRTLWKIRVMAEYGRLLAAEVVEPG